MIELIGKVVVYGAVLSAVFIVLSVILWGIVDIIKEHIIEWPKEDE